MSIEEVEKQIRESAPLSDRLTDCKDRIGKMCAEGRPPKMSIPSQWNDDDLFICTTLSDAQAVEQEKDEELAWMMNRNIDLERMWNASERYAKHCVTSIKETEAALAAAQGDNGKLREAIETMILFIPDGWQMPLGWNQVVAQAQEAIGGKAHQIGKEANHA
jgi:hypothetical protein